MLGIVLIKLIVKNSISFGWKDSGYALIDAFSSLSNYKGSSSSGYSAYQIDSQSSISFGTEDSGYAIIDAISSSNIYKGLNKSGYTVGESIKIFIWTGNIGTGWSVGDNWNLLDVPRIRHKVIIPSGLINYPKLNAGLFTIGQNKYDGQYFCKSMFIEGGAEVTLRINNQMQNYGNIIIFGLLKVESLLSPAVLNGTGGNVVIKSSGTLTW